MNFFDKVKKLLTNTSNNLIINTVVILIIGIAILIGISSFTKENLQLESSILLNSEKENTNEQQFLIEDYAKHLESKLENILKKIKGVGEVEVMITLEDSAERIPAFNLTEVEERTDEKDSQGGTRNIYRKDTTQQIVISNNNQDSLVVIKEVKPKVRGVIVVAQGANNIEIKEKLYTAVKTVLGITGNKVEVYSSK